MLAASIHLSRRNPLYLYGEKKSGMSDPDYDSMADYVDVESINAYQMLLDQGKSPEASLPRLSKLSRGIHVRPAMGCFSKCRFFNRHAMVESWEVL